jgi:hypothetical protein
MGDPSPRRGAVEAGDDGNVQRLLQCPQILQVALLAIGVVVVVREKTLGLGEAGLLVVEETGGEIHILSLLADLVNFIYEFCLSLPVTVKCTRYKLLQSHTLRDRRLVRDVLLFYLSYDW